MKLAKRTTRASVVILLVVMGYAVAASVGSAQSGRAGTPAATAKMVDVAPSAVRSSSADAAGTAAQQTTTTPSGPSSLLARGISPVMFAEGFEGTLSSWQVLGSPTWATTTYRAAAGQASAYCAQSTIPAPGPYADDMDAWLKAGPFDLSKVTAASLTYKLYLKSELEVDHAKCLVSLDGLTFYGWKSSGNTQGWIDRTCNLAMVPTIGSVCGKSQVWIAFKFDSDDVDTDEGAYIDEVKLTDQTPPSVTAIAPASGPVGSTVALSGAGLAGATLVSFNGVAAQFNAVSATQIDATVPAGASSGPITVTSPFGIGKSAASFTVTVPPKPAITKLSPTAGKRGVIVTLTGKNFGKRTSVSCVKFGAAKCAKYISWSATRIKCKVPAKAKFGRLRVKVTTAAGTSGARAFTVKR